MTKFSLFTFTVLFFVYSTVANAGLITNLTDEQLENSLTDMTVFDSAEDHLTTNLYNINYITAFGYDWAWASPVNAEFWYGLASNPNFNHDDDQIDYYNRLYSPLLQQNWDFAKQENGTLALMQQLTIGHFTNNETNELIQATQFFNSHFHYVDIDNMISKSFASEWVDPNDSFRIALFGNFETIYVRESASAPSPNPIPEPSTIAIFGLALIVFAIRTKKVSQL